MEFKRRRGSIMILFYKISSIPLLVLAIIVSLVLFKDFDIQSLYPIIFFSLSPVTGAIKYFSTYYTVEDGHLIIESGILNKMRKEIPFGSITTVDLSQNILFQIFKVYKIKVDNASQSIDKINKAEVEFALKIDEAIKFKQIVTQETQHDEIMVEDIYSKSFKATLQDFIKLGLLQSKIIYFFTGAPIITPILIGIATLATGSASLDELLELAFNQKAPVFVIVSFILFFYLTSLGYSLIKSVISFYDFRLSGDADSLRIEYGLFNKKKFTLQKNKINGVILKQNMIMKFLKCYTAEIFVIGYGNKTENEEQQKAMLFPIGSMKKINNIINELLPEFVIDEQDVKRNKGALRYYFFNFGFMLPLLVFGASFFSKNVTLIALLGGIVVLTAISVILQYLNSKVYSSKKNIILSYGGYHNNIAIVKTRSVESVTAKGSIFKRKRGFASISLGFVGPKYISNLTARNQHLDQFKKLEEVLKY